MKSIKNAISQTQFKRGTAPNQPVQPHSMDNREANPATQRKRNSRGLGTQTQARPGLAGLLSRSKPRGR